MHACIAKPLGGNGVDFQKVGILLDSGVAVADQFPQEDFETVELS